VAFCAYALHNPTAASSVAKPNFPTVRMFHFGCRRLEQGRLPVF
jgi:hypothetical protein